MFDLTRCRRRTVYCGGQIPIPPSSDPLVEYTRQGTPFECMKKGFGAGAAQERTKSLPATSLQRITFIGPTYEANLQRELGIVNSSQLAMALRGLGDAAFDAALRRALVRSTGAFDSRPYNALLAWMYMAGADVSGQSCA
jgi:hypothetical protein